MAEGIMGEVIGGEDEKPELEASETLARAEAFAAAIAAIASRQDPAVARKTEEFLEKQSQLLGIQAHHLKDEHQLRLSLLRDQLHEGRLRRVGIRLRLGLQVFFVFVALLLAVGAALMVRDAAASRSVVIEPFDSPPSLAADGRSGKVVAAGLLDVLTRIQVATRNDQSQRRLADA